MNIRITGSEKDKNDEVRVYFASENTDDFYYTHGTQEVGTPDDDMTNPHFTMWTWINHLRQKNWWTPQLEDGFRAAVEKHLHG